MTFEQRKNIRLPRHQYAGRRIYFVTICCEGRRRIFSDGAMASAAVEVLKCVSAATVFLMHAYCVMPEHVHLLVEGREEESDLTVLVGKLKQKIGYLWRRNKKRGGLESAPTCDRTSDPTQSAQALWQRGYYDHVLRRTEDSDGVAWYIWMNPVRQGLVNEPGQYAYSGSCTVEWPKSRRRAEEWIPPWKRLDGARGKMERVGEIARAD
jgi:putative transposase